MADFKAVSIDEVSGAQRFYKLIKNGRCQFDDFCSEIDTTYPYEKTAMFRSMDCLANGESLPKTKFHPWKLPKSGLKTFELKTRHLRIYMAEIGGGKLVVLGGYKNGQAKDGFRFASLMKEYEQHLNTSRNGKK